MRPDANPPATRKTPSRAQRIVVLGFLFAFGLTLLTVLLTGLATRSRDRGDAPETVSGQPENSR